MRHLVYRVQALSQSLLPLVWDFGTLKSRTDDGVDVECEYITQMIKKFVSMHCIHTHRQLQTPIPNLYFH